MHYRELGDKRREVLANSRYFFVALMLAACACFAFSLVGILGNNSSSSANTTTTGCKYNYYRSTHLFIEETPTIVDFESTNQHTCSQYNSSSAEE